ncbi:MAG TPA: arginine deiminase-related protein, partial [Burkholderiaceae bacterium]
MEPAHWAASATRLAGESRSAWLALKATYERLGAQIELQPPQPGLPDLVFTANAGVVLDRTALVSRFKCEPRQGEATVDRAFFEQLRARGVIDTVVDTPAGLCFEGAGDAIWDATRGVIWCGWGQRSDREMARVIEGVFGVPAVSLELVDPRFYHLDTCMCVLERGDVMVYPPAFSPASLATLEELVGREHLIVAAAEDALHLAVNSVCLGTDVVLCHASQALRAQLAARGYR